MELRGIFNLICALTDLKRPIRQQNLYHGITYSMCFVATIANRILVFHYYGNEIHFSIDTLFWIWLFLIPDLVVLLILYVLLFYVRQTYPRFSQIVGFCFALFIILTSSCNIIMLNMTGRQMEWNTIFEVDLTATYSLYMSQIYSILSLLFSYIVAGSMIWFVACRYFSTYKILQWRHFKTANIVFLSLILSYILIVCFHYLPEQYFNLSSNMVLTYFPKIIYHYVKLTPSVSIQMDETLSNHVAKIIRAPIVNISHPVTILKQPIKHVFVIVLESIRADALPLNDSLAAAVGNPFLPSGTPDQVTPFLYSLWKNSVRTKASVVSSYTLKSLLNIFCGIYSLNVDFLKEVNSEHTFYQQCLPDLLRDTFKTANNQSAFRSAFFTAARDDFDHQSDLFRRLKFDSAINGFDIYAREGRLRDHGMFGPADPYILPLMWKWVDDRLAMRQADHLMMSLLVTGTHEPFPAPFNRPDEEYMSYINDHDVNRYLNALRGTDDFLKDIFDGLKARNLYNETLFVITSDHGYVFNDYGRKMLGLLSTPLESALSVPFMLHNPHLEARQIDGQFTNMDILPTIMDILLSSYYPTQQQSNYLLSVPKNELQLVLSRYEGTTILRLPIEEQPVRYTFHLANPGNSFIIVKQYPKKLTYNIPKEKIHLYHLEHDPFELIDLITIEYESKDEHPTWIDMSCEQRWGKIWKRYLKNNRKTYQHCHKSFNLNESTSTVYGEIHSKVKLIDMLDWADDAFELARLWKHLIKQRYLQGNIL